ncbi:MAG: hypothetical protein NC099_01975 [Corallococcus sp.]|nr:hypothetical protein [Corallococcus sp.]
MKRTVDEKLRYNEEQNSMFGTGYVLGVKNYRNYVRLDTVKKRSVDEIVCKAKKGVADPETDRDMQQLYKGILCGIRDAANERKERKNRLP